MFRGFGFKSDILLSIFVVCSLVLVVYEWDQTLVASNAKPLSEAFSATVTAVGILLFTRASVQVVAQPFWGYASDFMPRKWILFAGCFIWGTMTTIMASTSSWPLLIVLRGCAGLGLGAILPAVHHLIVDSFVSKVRGRIFGALGAFQMIGGIASIAFATNFSSQENFAGVAGWRFTFFCTGVFGLIVAVICLCYLKGAERVRGLSGVTDSQRGIVRILNSGEATTFGTLLSAREVESLRNDNTQDDREGTNLLCNCMCCHRMRTHLKDMWHGLLYLLGIRTFLILFLRSAFDGIPMNANVLLILWFEYMGYLELHASQLCSVMLVGFATSSLVFGWLGDEAQNWRGGRSRIWVALFALTMQLCMTLVLFRGGPVTGSGEGNSGTSNPDDDYWQWLVILAVLGFFGDADQQACDYPLIGDIVHPSRRGLAYGIADMVQCFFAFLSTVIVGLLTEDVFGFVHDNSHPVKDWDVGTRERNVKALGSALFVVNVSAVLGSLVLYILMLYTYEGDAARLRKELSKERQMVEDCKDKIGVEEAMKVKDGQKIAAPASTDSDASLLLSTKELAADERDGDF